MKQIGQNLSQKNKSGFTLIELLVVTAILTILTSLLLPALQSARQNLKSVSCANNMRQVGQAILLYANDFQGFFPPDPYSGGVVGYWQFAIDAYLIQRPSTAVYTRTYSKVWSCPSNPPEIMSSDSSFSCGRPSYVINAWWIQPYTVSLSSISNPSSKVVLLELDWQKRVQTGNTGSRTSIACANCRPTDVHAYFGHKNGMNIFFADGHVSWLPSSNATFDGSAASDTKYWKTD